MSGEGEAPAERDIATIPLARPAAVMAVGTALSRLTGLGRVIALAFALGVTESRVADSYNIANTLPNVLLRAGARRHADLGFHPRAGGRSCARSDHEEAWRSVSALVTASLALLVAMTVATVLAAPAIIDLFTARVPGPEAQAQHDLATFLLRLFAPQIALYGFAAIAAGLLNAHGRFALADVRADRQQPGRDRDVPGLRGDRLRRAHRPPGAGRTGPEAPAGARHHRWGGGDGGRVLAVPAPAAREADRALRPAPSGGAQGGPPVAAGRCSTWWSTRSGSRSPSTWPTASRAAPPPT